MDQKRLLLAIALSVAILLGFQLLMPQPPKPPAVAQAPIAAPAATATATATAGATPSAAPTEQGGEQAAVLRAAPRARFTAPRLQGSISLLGARLDDLVLRDYRETIAPDSKLVRLLEPRGEAQPYYVQFGWTAAAGSAAMLPGNDTVWTASGELTDTSRMTLSWTNPQGQIFEIILGLDREYMFTVEQKVTNGGAEALNLHPFARIRRDYTPQTDGYYILHEGLLGVLDGKLKEMKYSDVKSDGEKKAGLAFDTTTTGGWAGITDKYWLTALVPDQAVPVVAAYRHIADNGDRYQVDLLAKDAQAVAPGVSASRITRLFAGAKEVHLLDRYEASVPVPAFDKAVDFGWFYYVTKPFFYAIDFLNGLLGNFGLAIMAFTLLLKLLFFPLANKSYRSMSKMKLLSPKITELREQYKDEPQKLQSAMMQLYKTEKVNPVSGCLPMLIQIPIFFSLYKVIFVTIEMRQAPFFGWIRDLSAVDPTNVFNLFGLIPFDPSGMTHYLHLGAWPLIMGVTMYFQQKLNPPPPDPMQAKLFQFMPIIFTFMLSSFPAGLVIYWSWNNTLTIIQQTLIMRGTRLDKPGAAVVSKPKAAKS